MTKPMLKNLITRSVGYDEEDTKLMYEGIDEEKKERELLEQRKRQDNLELEKLRMEAQIGLNQEILSRNNRIPIAPPLPFLRGTPLFLQNTTFQRHGESGASSERRDREPAVWN
ncbi:hypothetical protein TNCT_263321 [Trichonephila clavata]|uniref:Uncharacterized protein n=1 Tax=Trichonephila clavata TaxID=2740835 RepID=A0A8X6H4W0_TRICU|nr:hypothetical protein TNCT_263321 [Trichonephila clavata]